MKEQVGSEASSKDDVTLIVVVVLVCVDASQISKPDQTDRMRLFTGTLRLRRTQKERPNDRWVWMGIWTGVWGFRPRRIIGV